MMEMEVKLTLTVKLHNFKKQFYIDKIVNRLKQNKRCLNKGESDGLRPQLYEPFFMWTVIFSMVPSENWI